MKSLNTWLTDCFAAAALRPALLVNDKEYSYASLWSHAGALQDQMKVQQAKEAFAKAAYIGVIGHRSATAYSGILAIILSGKGYLPLNLKFPISRLITMIETSAAKQILVCPEATDVANKLKVQFPDLDFIAADIDTNPPATFIECNALQNDTTENAAYLMFTSGSTGKPKGVPISRGNLLHYLKHMSRMCALTPQDRCSHTFDLSFDLSVHDILITWLSGACLCVLPEKYSFAPGKFIKAARLTVWFSVPSLAHCMQALKLLKPNSYPTLRLSLFCGEALMQTLAEDWRAAAPNSRLLNLYGPTEATIACAAFEITQNTSVTPHQRRTNPNKGALVPIGKGFGENQISVIDQEICISGPQLTQGYLNAPQKNKTAFFNHNDQTWYHSGDCGQGEDPIHYLGRADDQVKINGFRIELLEVDSVVKAAVGHGLLKSIAWPIQHPKQQAQIYLFLEAAQSQSLKNKILQACNTKLPTYMQPKHIRFLEKLPLNTNGKIDKQALISHLETQKDEQHST